MLKDPRLISPKNHIIFIVIVFSYLAVISEGALTASETHISTTRNADRTSICGYYSA
jgi:hypothetical protein